MKKSTRQPPFDLSPELADQLDRVIKHIQSRLPSIPGVDTVVNRSALLRQLLSDGIQTYWDRAACEQHGKKALLLVVRVTPTTRGCEDFAFNASFRVGSKEDSAFGPTLEEALRAAIERVLQTTRSTSEPTDAPEAPLAPERRGVGGALFERHSTPRGCSFEDCQETATHTIVHAFSPGQAMADHYCAPHTEEQRGRDPGGEKLEGLWLPVSN